MPFFSIKCLQRLKIYPTLLETVGLRVLTRNLRDFILFNFDFERRSCPAKCASVANTISKAIQWKVCSV